MVRKLLATEHHNGTTDHFEQAAKHHRKAAKDFEVMTKERRSSRISAYRIPGDDLPVLPFHDQHKSATS